MSEFDQLVAAVAKAGVQPSAQSVSQIARSLVPLCAEDRKPLLNAVQHLLMGQGSAASEKNRVVLVKILVALLPDSKDALLQLLSWRGEVTAYETHFTIFCFLDEVKCIAAAQEVAAELPTIIENYLMGIDSDCAEAAWMAGDLIGDHWDLTVGLPTLDRASLHARHVPGRMGAIHGLVKAMDHTRNRSKILALLRRIAGSDPSQDVREYARLALDPR